MKRIWQFIIGVWYCLTSRTVYVDFDGTLVHYTFSYILDALWDYNHKLMKARKLDELISIEKIEQGLDNLNALHRRYFVLFFCLFLKMLGKRLVILTNRSYAHRPMTVKNLGLWKILFSNIIFCSHAKGDYIDSYQNRTKKCVCLIDNDEVYIKYPYAKKGLKV